MPALRKNIFEQAESADSDRLAPPQSFIRAFLFAILQSTVPSDSVNGKRSPVQTEWMSRLIWVFLVRLFPKDTFSREVDLMNLFCPG